MIKFEEGKTFITNINGTILSFTMTKLPLDSEGNAQDQSFHYGPYGMYIVNGRTMIFEYCDTQILETWDQIGVFTSDKEVLNELWSRFLDEISSDSTTSVEQDADEEWFLKDFKPRVIAAVRSRYQN